MKHRISPFFGYAALALLAASPACAADTKISNMTDGGTVQSTDSLPAVRSGANVKVHMGTAASSATGDFATAAQGAKADTSVQDSVTAAGATLARTLESHFSDVKNAADFGAVCDGIQRTDCNITNGAATLSCTNYHFTSGDIGKHIVVSNAAETQGLTTTISSLSGNNAVLASNWSGTTISGNNGRATFYNTDNTTPLQNALNAFGNPDAGGYNQSGFKLEVPNGICATGPLTIPRLSILECADDWNGCELFLISGSNGDLLKSENFAGQTGTGHNYGTTAAVPSWFGIKNIHLDGNKVGQSSGRCYAGYGNMQMMLGEVLVENCHDDCIFTEASDSYAYSVTDWKSQEEGVFQNVKTRNCGRYGWLDRGPHDKYISNFIDAESASTGYRNEASAGFYSGSAHINKMHTYTEADHSGMYFASPITVDELYADFANIEFAPGANSSKIGSVFTTACGFGGVDCIIIDGDTGWLKFGPTDIEMYVSASAVAGVHFKSGAGGNSTMGPISGSQILASGAVTLVKNEQSFNNIFGVLSDATATNSTCYYSGGSYNVVSLTGFSCYNFIDFTADGGNNIINYAMFLAGGTNYTTGTVPTTDTLILPNDAGSGLTQIGNSGGAFRAKRAGFETTGSVPAVASGSGDCGTSPSILGNNHAGEITVGSSTNGGKCTVTFANSFAFAHPPECLCMNKTTANLLKPVSTTTTLACTGTLTAADKISYICEGYY